MPECQFALEKDGPPRIAMSWSGEYHRFRVFYDDQQVGKESGRVLLRRGEVFALPDGTSLRIQLHRSFGIPELVVERDGVPLPGSASDPLRRLKEASHVAYFVGCVTLVGGVLSLLTRGDMLRELGMGWESMAGGVLFLALALFIGRGSRVALGLTVTLLLIDTVYLFGARLETNRGAVSSVVVRFLLLVVLVKGFTRTRLTSRPTEPTDREIPPTAIKG